MALTPVPPSPPPSAKPQQREHLEQADFFMRLRMAEKRHPALARVYAIPNGARVGRSQAQKLVREGLKAGVSDVCVPLVRGGFPGAYVEFKAPPNMTGKSAGTVKKHQSKFLEDSAEEGYWCIVVDDAAVAYSLVLAYATGRIVAGRRPGGVEDHRTHRRRI